MRFTAQVSRNVRQTRTIEVHLDPEDLLQTTLEDAIEEAIGGHNVDVLDEDDHADGEWELDGSTIEEG